MQEQVVLLFQTRSRIEQRRGGSQHVAFALSPLHENRSRFLFPAAMLGADVVREVAPFSPLSLKGWRLFLHPSQKSELVDESKQQKGLFSYQLAADFAIWIEK